ncbi:unnamed protein product [Mytilus edulis]|uniref:Uncharacterized protein n=1 Tax=Mytilus edulis TaxID=6550 RepID=A0A8S3VI68_MYTED|nr:unnamed protein product [Mytilus edulis]
MDCKITNMSDQRENMAQEVEILENTDEETLKWREVGQDSPWIVKDIKDVNTRNVEISVRSITVVAFKQAKNPRGIVAITPVPVKAEPRVLLVNTKLTTEQAPSATDTALSKRTCAQCDGKSVGTIIGRVAEGMVTCMHMNVRDGIIGFQVYQCHLVGLGFLELQWGLNRVLWARTRSGSECQRSTLQPLGLVTHINDKQWIKIDEIGGVNVAVADETVHVELVRTLRHSCTLWRSWFA